MDSEQTSGRPPYLWWLLPILVLVGGLVLTALIAPRSLLTVDRLTNELSRAHHEQLSRTLRRQLSETLSAASGLTHGNDAAFPGMASEFLERFPGVAGLELLALVRHDQRPLIEKRLTEQSGQFIRFLAWNEGGGTGGAEVSDQYLIIRNARFQSQTLTADSSLGLVATSVPHWRGPLKRALEEDRTTATTLTGLQRNGVDQHALRIFVPASGSQQSAGDRLIAIVLQPDVWLNYHLKDLHDPRWQVELHDISQHARHPMALMLAASLPADDVAPTRSAVGGGP